MRYWDSSAIVPLVIDQGASPRTRELFGEDPEVMTWILSDIELRSAVCRLEREAALEPEAAELAMERFAALWSSFQIVSMVEPVKLRARRLLRVHPLRAADSMQLGAGLVGCSDDPHDFEFVSLDDRLSGAARREGFRVLP